jgi:hypothetical protein
VRKDQTVRRCQCGTKSLDPDDGSRCGRPFEWFPTSAGARNGGGSDTLDVSDGDGRQWTRRSTTGGGYEGNVK